MFKVLIPIVIVAVWSTSLAHADENADLQMLTQQRFDANSANDRSFYEHLLSPNFIFLAPFNPPQTKKEYLDSEFRLSLQDNEGIRPLSPTFVHLWMETQLSQPIE